MFFKEWEVLLVDDEPDVLSVSKLAMQDFEVYGLPLKLHMAESKAQAVELFQHRPELAWGLSVALIDVVMESDSAGLELCQHVREEMGNKFIQLFIRTGQPGIAPERSVMDRYDINGYFTKAEATEDKLYSLVKSGVRQFLWARNALVMSNMLDSFVRASSRDEFINAMTRVASRMKTSAERQQVRMQWGVGDVAITAPGWDEATAKAVYVRLNEQEGIPLGAEGDKFVSDEQHYHLVQVVPGADAAQAYYLFQSAFAMPREILDMVHRVMGNIGILWQRLDRDAQ